MMPLSCLTKIFIPLLATRNILSRVTVLFYRAEPKVNTNQIWDLHATSRILKTIWFVALRWFYSLESTRNTLFCLLYNVAIPNTW